MIPQKYYDFQDDIKNGMTIQKALHKHGLTLDKAFTALQFQNHNIHKKKQKKTLMDRTTIHNTKQRQIPTPKKHG